MPTREVWKRLDDDMSERKADLGQTIAHDGAVSRACSPALRTRTNAPPLPVNLAWKPSWRATSAKLDVL